MAVRFKLKESAILMAAVSAAFPAAAAQSTAQAGRVDFATTGVSARGGDGRSRALAKGAEIFPGDTIQTQDEGRAQLRFTDGGQISLQPRSEFRIENYRFAGQPDGSESAVFNLIRGGLRTITGLVGSRDRKSYQLRTQVATIGIRGTQFSVSYGNSITITATEGAVEACNAAGCLTATQGQTIFVRDENSRPTLISRKVDLPPAPLPAPQFDFASTEQRTAESRLQVLPSPSVPLVETYLAVGTNTAVNLAFAHDPTLIFSGGECCFGVTRSKSEAFIPGSTTLGTSLQMVGFNDLGTPTGPVTWPGSVLDAGTDATLNGGGTNAIIAWGRWTGDVTGGTGERADRHFGSFSGGESLHYVVGVPTPAADMLALRTANVTNATYSLIGATTPTNYASTGVLNNATLGVNFVAGTVNTALNLTISGTTINVNATNIPIASGSSGFSTALGGNVSVSSSDFTCSDGCNASINGFFAGRMASRAGYAYRIGEGSSASPSNPFLTIATGAVAFQKGGTAINLTPPPQQNNNNFSAPQ